MKAEVTINKQLNFNLSLSEIEARTLMGMIQNPLNNIDPNDEDPIEREIRFDLFHALKDGLNIIDAS